MTTDIGMEWLSSTDLVVLGLCLFLTFLAFKMRSFPFSAVASFAWITEGLLVFKASEEFLPFILMFAIASGVMLYGWKHGEWKL